MQTTPGFDVVELFKFLRTLWRLRSAYKRQGTDDSSTVEPDEPKPILKQNSPDS
jgi:hypothetical protein